MDAWETLIAGSTIASGDAWEHLQAQGGGGDISYLILADGLEVEMAGPEIDVDIQALVLETEIQAAEIAVEIDQAPLEVEI